MLSDIVLSDYVYVFVIMFRTYFSRILSSGTGRECGFKFTDNFYWVHYIKRYNSIILKCLLGAFTIFAILFNGWAIWMVYDASTYPWKYSPEFIHGYDKIYYEYYQVEWWEAQVRNYKRIAMTPDDPKYLGEDFLNK